MAQCSTVLACGACATAAGTCRIYPKAVFAGAAIISLARNSGATHKGSGKTGRGPAAATRTTVLANYLAHVIGIAATTTATGSNERIKYRICTI